MTFSLAAVQLMFLMTGQVQTTNAVAPMGTVGPAGPVSLLAGGCLGGDTAPCTTTSGQPGVKTCRTNGSWGACVANQGPPPCPSTTCRPATLVFEDPGWTCVTSNAAPTTSCDTDGDACNGVDKCDGAGACVAGVPPNPDDGNPATLDYCGPDGVKHVPISSNGTAKEAFATPTTGPDPRSRALPVAPNAGGPVVDESRGTLNYQYSFELPAARGRYQPRLTLGYSSATTYNNSVGAGWSLTSFYIEADTATPPTSGADNAPLQYWLVMDGSRSKLVKAGTTDKFRTQVQGAFVDITFTNNITRVQWSATDAAGTTYNFFRRSPSLVTFGPGGRWYLSELVDVDGNITRYTYTDETGASSLLTKVEYNLFAAGAQVGTSVELTWTADTQSRAQRAADTVSFGCGSPETTGQRLIPRV